MKSCPFCFIPTTRIRFESEYGFVIRDSYPVSPGHTLIISKRHLSSFFELSDEEKIDLLKLLEIAKGEIDSEFSPDGYNIGINVGLAGGQTVQHLHIHLMPRFNGDKEDPRGGVRWIFPEKADYWSKM